MEEYAQDDGLGLAALGRPGAGGPEARLAAAMARLKAHNPRRNAVVTPRVDEARTALRAGLPSGPLPGVPWLRKDCARAAGPGVRAR